ncbi:MAG: hypothetical protein QM763_08410 [Agriterribacter sp.]
MKFLNRRKYKILSAIRSSWAGTKEKYRNRAAFIKYDNLCKDKYYYHSLTEQTLLDIDIDSLLEYIDRTETSIGQQYLYHILLHPTNDLNQLNEIHEQSVYFQHNTAIRERVLYELVLLEKAGCEGFVDIFTAKPNVFKKHAAFQFLTALSIISFAGIFFFKPAFIFFLVVAFVNIALHYILQVRNEPYYNMLRHIHSSIVSVKKIKDVLPDTRVYPGFKEDIIHLKPFSKYYSILNFGRPHDDLSATILFLLELVKGVFLAEIHIFHKLFTLAQHKKHSLLNIYKFLGATDMHISIASVLSDASVQTCHPVLSDKKECLQFEDARHPVIDNCQPNSLTVSAKSVLITGSNMSGKSSFLRTILINSILSQTVSFCFAKRYISPILKQYSCIAINDDLLNAKSYYLKELLCIKQITDQANGSTRNLFLIDEIFKGTNTIERVALATNTLLYLTANSDIVIASTHDLEIAGNLSQSFDEYHFADSVIDGELHFNYALNKGRLKTRNAIKLAKLAGYPESVLNGAMTMVERSLSSSDNVQPYRGDR